MEEGVGAEKEEEEVMMDVDWWEGSLMEKEMLCEKKSKEPFLAFVVSSLRGME